jgi:uncharacterized protein
MPEYKTPGVYVEEISLLPPSVVQVETAIPAFIGFTQNDTYNSATLVNKPMRIKSLKEYEEIFGSPENTVFTNTTPANGIEVVKVNGQLTLAAPLVDPALTLRFRMHYALRLYFGNGGGPCYIISSGKTAPGLAIGAAAFDAALLALRKEDEPTMIVFTDAVGITDPVANYYGLYTRALAQSAELMDRVTLIDVFPERDAGGNLLTLSAMLPVFRGRIGNNNLSYGAAYFPWLQTTLPYFLNESQQPIRAGAAVTADDIPNNMVLRKYPVPPSTTVPEAETTTSLYHRHSDLYNAIRKEMDRFKVISPPSPAIAGVYAAVDASRGVWKAPANVSLNLVKEPLVKIDDLDQQDMNVTPTGKSVNAIRFFSGKGVLVWGARTLAGNDNEWRYISVRRFFNMVEESVKKATEPFVFESNDSRTWTKVRAMIENFLILQWRAGALQGGKPEEAFFVGVGLGQTMTALDILEGRMIVEIGMAVVRPAEFIILRFSHRMVQS